MVVVIVVEIESYSGRWKVNVGGDEGRDGHLFVVLNKKDTHEATQRILTASKSIQKMAY